MNFKIVADSSADMLTLDGAAFANAPLKINVGERVFVDDDALNLKEMVDVLRAYKGRTSSACPNPDEFLAAFGDADRVFCITISSNLSGSCNAARLAAAQYEEEHPQRKVYIIDSLSAGAELTMIAYKLAEMIAAGMEYEAICVAITDYQAHTRTLFMLQSVHNLANNGRLNPAVAALVGMLGIRMVGKASDHGTLELTSKARGDKRALGELVAHMKKEGYAGGLVRIHHCMNETGANMIRELVLGAFPQARIVIGKLRGLCSYYAESGGIIVGYEIA